MLNVLRALKTLLPLLRLKVSVLGAMLILGVLTALSEGLSISLLIPLLQSQALTKSTGIARMLIAPFETVPADRRMLWIGGTMLVCLLLKNVLSYSYSRLLQRVTASIGHRLRSSLLHQLLSVGQSYLDTHDSGKLLNTLGETWRVTSAFTLLAGFVINGCITVMLIVLLALISWKLTLLSACLLLVISSVIRRLTRHVKRLSREATAANVSLSRRMLEIFHGSRLIRAFGREGYEQNRYNSASQQVAHAFLKIGRISELVRPVSEMLTAPLLLGIFLIPTMQRPGEIATSVTFLVLLYRLQPRVKQMDADRLTLDTLSAPIEEVASLMDKSDKPYLQSGVQELGPIRQDISFVDVCFTYDLGKAPALNNLNFSIGAGQTTALIGPSGAGKSTVINLICRFYDPSSGRLLIDGVPLKKLNLEWWRNQIAMVSQDVHLFNATVAENIIYGKLDATRAELLDATRKAHALQFIEDLPEGFETVLGDRGIRLSGGQRQRLALARAFIRDPQILILDEATNSLDLIAEELVHDALEEFGRDRTVIIIAHRISTIESADKIIVLESGRVAETGPVPELLANNGLFSRLYSLQLRKARTNTRLISAIPAP
jgi:subfamily B ATP-binding cassette protein MsbA